MNNSNTIDYNSKVMNFMAMTETGDPEVATKYLESAGWDETLAVNNFFSKIKVNNNFNNNYNDNIMRDEYQNNNILNRNLINNANNNNQENEGFFSKYILSPFRALLEACSERREVELEEEEKIFHLLPNKVHDTTRFCQLIKTKIGIIIFYNGNSVQFLNSFINELSRNTNLINLLKKYFFVYPLLASTNEGYRMESVISDNKINYPSFVFCFNNSNMQRGDFTDLIFDRNHIINILEGESINLDTFNNALIDCTEKVGFYNNENGFGPMTDGEVLEQQKSDMEALERQVLKREEELKKQKVIEEQRKKEEEIKKKELEKKVNEAKKKIVEEPKEDDINSTVICFRYPDGEKIKNRRFLKTHTIQNLYDYVTSLGKEIYTEEENNNFSLYQPFPPKKYVEMENTLEKEGLFPNAVIQIREEE